MRRYIFFLSILFSTGVFAQKTDFSKIKPGGVKFYLNKDSSSYFRFFGFTHIWARYMEMNPGTTDLDGKPMQTDFDIGIRRNRSGFYFHLSDRLTSMMQFGISAQTYTSKTTPQIFFLDLTTEYGFIKDKFHVGYGLHSWNGIARQNNIGAPHFLYIDNPGFSYPLVGTFDQSGRQLGFYAKGLLNDFEYRISISKPFSYNALDKCDTLYHTAYEYHNSNYAYKGYFNWQFFDNEKDLFPWKRMNYLGEKRIFNIGLGFYYQPEAMRSYRLDIEKFQKHDVLLLGIDVFLELPQSNYSSITAYLVWFNYDFGPNYIKKGGLMNNGVGGSINGAPLLQGGGNGEWSHGTGNILHFEAGYLLPEIKRLNGRKIQLFAGYTFKKLDALGCDLHQFDTGLNFLVFRNHVKWGVQYSTRPIYDGTIGSNANGSINTHKSTIIFNTQIDF